MMIGPQIHISYLRQEVREAVGCLELRLGEQSTHVIQPILHRQLLGITDSQTAVNTAVKQQSTHN